VEYYKSGARVVPVGGYDGSTGLVASYYQVRVYFEREGDVKRLVSVGLALIFVQLFLTPLPGGPAAEGDKDVLPTVEQIIDRYTDALGGRDAIERLTSRVCIGRMVHDLSWKTPTYEVIPIVAYSKVPDYVLVIEHKSEGIRCEGSDGNVTWVQDPAGVRLEDTAIRAKTAWLFDPRGALRMKTYFPGLQVKSKETLDGRQVYVLLPAELAEAHYALYFDVDTGLLVRIGYYWDLKEYSKVDGVKFPFRVEMSRKGGSSTYEFHLVSHNLPLEDVIFSLPAVPDKPR
jgi:hypothetical protein